MRKLTTLLLVLATLTTHVLATGVDGDWDTISWNDYPYYLTIVDSDLGLDSYPVLNIRYQFLEVVDKDTYTLNFPEMVYLFEESGIEPESTELGTLLNLEAEHLNIIESLLTDESLSATTNDAALYDELGSTHLTFELTGDEYQSTYDTSLDIHLDKACQIEVTVPVGATTLMIDVNKFYEPEGSVVAATQNIVNNSIYPVTIDILGATGSDLITLVGKDDCDWENLSKEEAASNMALAFVVDETPHWFEAEATHDLGAPEASYHLNGDGGTLSYTLDAKHGLAFESTSQQVFNVHVLIKPKL